MLKPPQPMLITPTGESADTILGSPVTPEERDKRSAEEQDWDRYRILLDVLFEGYENGDILMPDLVRIAVNCGKDFAGDSLLSLPPGGRHQVLGQFIEKAAATEPKRTASKLRSNQPLPDSLRKLCLELFNIAVKRGKSPFRRDELPKKHRAESAPYFVAQRMIQFGIFTIEDGQTENEFVDQYEKKVANYYVATRK